MTGEIEAAGDALTGGLIARAVEPGADAHGETAHQICRNCGTALAGDYCHACGQPGHLHRSLAAIWHDLAHGVLHFEGKIWRTLPMLAFRPGELTRRYIAGERARFVSPLALFLFSVFLMFAVISALGGDLAPSGAKARAAIDAEAAKALDDLERRLGARSVAAAAGRDTSEIDVEIAELRDDLRRLDRLVVPLGGDRISIDAATGWQRLDKGIAKASANPSLLLYKLQSNAYKFSWALIPLSVPFVWLLFFWRRDLHVYDHTIFVTYSLAFMSLLAIALTLLMRAGAPGDAIELAAMLLPPVHLFRHLRGTYRLERRAALIRLFLLLVFAFVALVLFVMLLLGLGLLG